MASEIEEAQQKRQASITALNGWINDTKTVLTTTPEDKQLLVLNVAQVNDTFEEFKKSHMDYVALVVNLDEKSRLKDEYDAIVLEVGQVRTDVQNGIEALEKSAKKTDGEDKTNQKEDVDDGASIVSSKSAKIQAATKRAALEIKAKMLKRKQEIEFKEQQLRQEKDRLALEAEIEIAKAEESAIIIEEEGSDCSKGNKTLSSSDKEVSFKVLPTTESIQCSILEQQSRLIDVLQAPKTEIPVFSGDPLKYYVFMRSFEDNVDKRIKDYPSKFSRLLQYTSGRALGIVQGCAIMDPRARYNRAMRLLKDRYGNMYKITEAWVNEIMKFPNVKSNDGMQLQEFADLLRNCFNTLDAMNALTEINTQTSLIQIVAKLPSSLQGSWRKEVIRIKRRTERMPRFSDLVNFVEDLAEEANIPGLSYVSKGVERTTEPQKTRKSATYTTQTGDPIRKCNMCDSNSHPIWECEKFRALSSTERFDIAKRKHLCFNCLKSGSHGSRICKSPRRCTVDKCGRRHHTLLHPDNDKRGKVSLKMYKMSTIQQPTIHQQLLQPAFLWIK